MKKNKNTRTKKYSSEKRKLFHRVIGYIAINLYNNVLDEKAARRYIMDTHTITSFLHRAATHIENLGWVGNENKELEDILIMIDDIMISEFKITPTKQISTAGAMIHWLANHAENSLYKQDLRWRRELFDAMEGKKADNEDSNLRLINPLYKALSTNHKVGGQHELQR